MTKKKILITCGPTWVPIDDVRVISNHSSGEMGHLIAQESITQGSQVTLIEGPVTHAWSNKNVKIIKYRFFDELQKILNLELKKKCDVVIQAAAISDFKVKNRIKGKISSVETRHASSLQLISTPKIINQIKKINPKIFLVGFKLQSSLNLKQVRRLFNESDCDLVVANSLKGGYHGVIVNPGGRILAKASNKKNLAKALVKLLV